MANFFGTDGIRGIFGQNLTINLAQTVGNALTQKIKNPKQGKPFLLLTINGFLFHTNIHILFIQSIIKK